jgi:hypothetical protein
MNASKYLSLALTSLLVVFQAGNVIAASAAPSSAIVFSPITSTPPADIPGGAKNASLQAAAIFAWQEFIALNWPAKAGVRHRNSAQSPASPWFGTPSESLAC